MIIILILVMALAFLAIREKVRFKAERSGKEDGSMPEPKSSPLSEAIVEIVATAGGVYLALVMVTSFLKLSLPGIVYIFGIGIDPLAGLALVLAFLQPFLIRLIPVFVFGSWK